MIPTYRSRKDRTKGPRGLKIYRDKASLKLLCFVGYVRKSDGIMYAQFTEVPDGKDRITYTKEDCKNLIVVDAIGELLYE